MADHCILHVIGGCVDQVACVERRYHEAEEAEHARHEPNQTVLQEVEWSESAVERAKSHGQIGKFKSCDEHQEANDSHSLEEVKVSSLGLVEGDPLLVAELL